ncbi:P-loop ATPase, Sll1717 family [Micromonospora sp. DT228]|uniref:P-loop ATPase, Sll1717 family n=1 Tax=Micromonospora sp. DT228 TaxID=3393443 RepID=UPI003CE9734D
MVRLRTHIEARLPDATITVSADRGGLLARVVDSGFDGESIAQRKEVALGDDIPELVSQLHTIELLTPAEEPWFGPVFREQAELPPVWGTALERTKTDLSSVVFASDLDEGLAVAPIVTFYSLRGGVGRSTALASVARLLTTIHRLRVVTVDMDLEAPGLGILFGIEEQIGEDQGVLAALNDLEYDDNIDILSHVLPVDEDNRLFCMPAGHLSAAYAQRLSALDVEIWYREQRNPLHRLIEMLQASPLRPDAILIDSRTGLSPIAGPLLFDVSDLAIIFFHPQAQAKRGTELLTQAMLSTKTKRHGAQALTPEPRFVVSPMPPGPSSEVLAQRAIGWVESWLQPLTVARGRDGLSSEAAVHIVGYNAEVGFRDVVAPDPAALVPYQPVADWVIQLVPERAKPSMGQSEPSKRGVLADLSFEADTAEQQNSLLDDYVVTEHVAEAASASVPLVIGRKGTGKTALFRWLAERPGSEAIIVAAPNKYPSRPAWSLSEAAYGDLERVLRARDLTWSTFWLVHLTLVVHASLSRSGARTPPLPDGFSAVGPDLSVLQIISRLEATLGQPRCGLLAEDWLQRASSAIDGQRPLLFDGFDTAFGNDSKARHRRSESLSALLSVQAEVGHQLANLPFKIMIRQDIWDALRFNNKSHFYASSLRLRWESSTDYYKVVVKQAMAVPSFERVARLNAPNLPDREISEWSAQDVEYAWNTLIGERMKGEQTAFTWNWVWKRLADANGDHSPRTLIQLFNEALNGERQEYRRSQYERSVIRPRLLVRSLPVVSDMAVEALREEFGEELDPVIAALRRYGRTPIPEADLALEAELVDTAVEVGLLARREESSGRRILRVPDLYRHALGVTRPGPS